MAKAVCPGELRQPAKSQPRQSAGTLRKRAHRVNHGGTVDP